MAGMDSKNKIHASIVGAGPAGLAAGFFLANRGKNIAIFEKEKYVGGISKTISYNNCRFDIGGHRLFTFDKEVMNWWRKISGSDMLSVKRKSSIFLDNKFIKYPLNIFDVMKHIESKQIAAILKDYFIAKLTFRQCQDNYESYMIKKFGRKLYDMFFKSYTEKVWGVNCNELSSDWAKERIGRLSLSRILKNTLTIKRNTIHPSLTEYFEYPKNGIGQLFVAAAGEIKKMGGNIFTEHKLNSIYHNDKEITSLNINNCSFDSDYYILSAPITEVVNAMVPAAPDAVLHAAGKLKFRNIVLVNMIAHKYKSFSEQWIYVHNPSIKLARIQNFKNWSPYMSQEEDLIPLGLEYFCYDTDELWMKDDNYAIDLAVREITEIGILKHEEIAAAFVLKIPYAYPLYRGDYRMNVEVIMKYLENFKNLKIIGRAGLYKYIHMDKAIASGFAAARNTLN